MAQYENNDFDANDFGAGDDFRPQEVVRPRSDTRKPPPFKINDLDLLSPPGFVGDVARWIDGQCRYPRRNLVVASAIVAIGNIGGLRYDDEYARVTSNMIAFCVAGSGTGKEAVLQAVQEIIRVCSLGPATHGIIKSEQEVGRNLIDHQAAMYVVDEIGLFLKKVKNAQKGNGASYLEGLIGIVMSAFTKANSFMLVGGDTKRDLRKIYAAAVAKAEDSGIQEDIDRIRAMLAMVDDGLVRPFLSIIGFTTPSTFDDAMDGDAANQGFAGRSIIVTEKENNPRERMDFSQSPMPENMIARLLSINNGGAFNSMERKNARIENYGPRIPVETDDDAKELLRLTSLWLHDYADEVGEGVGESAVAMIRRGREMILKISFILAIPGRVRTADMVRWAFAYVIEDLDEKIKLVYSNDNKDTDPDGATAATILRMLDTDKGMSVKVLSNRMKKKADTVTAVLTKMAARGMVREQTGQKKYAGKPVTVWVRVKE